METIKIKKLSIYIDKKNYFSYIAIRKVRKAHSPVAQSAEQVAVNHWVPGSSPGGGANEAVVKRQPPFLLPKLVPENSKSPRPGSKRRSRRAKARKRGQGWPRQAPETAWKESPGWG